MTGFYFKIRLKMNVRLPFFSLCIMLITTLSVYPQEIKQEKRLAPGDKVPDVEFQLYNKGKVKLSDFIGKVVILEFFTTSCGPCIAKMPYLDSLQHALPEIVKILPVSRDYFKQSDYSKLEKMIHFLKGKRPQFDLPFSIHDTVASMYFPHRGIPHYVWINKKGEFLFATSGDEISLNAIRDVFDNKPIAYAEKIDHFNFDEKKPLFIHGNGGEERAVIFKNTITGYLPGVISRTFIQSKDTGHVTRLIMSNATIIDLYRMAYGFKQSLSRIVLEVLDKNKYIPSATSKEWWDKNQFCYELICPPAPLPAIKKLMRECLLSTFGSNGYFERRTLKCLVIKAGDSVLRKTAAVPAVEDDYEYSNYAISTIVRNLNEVGNIPFVDDTGGAEVMIRTNLQEMLNRKKLESLLTENGFRLVEEEREVDVFVIKEVR